MYLRLPQILIHNAGSHMAVKRLAAFSLSFAYDLGRLASLPVAKLENATTQSAHWSLLIQEEGLV